MSKRVAFVGVFEIWEEGKLQYLPVSMEGEFIPTQTDMVLRENLSKVIGEQYGYDCLDLIGVSVNGQMEWSDGSGSRQQ